jgi:inosine-uridine nucleoside N-ribohydrolase
LDRRRLLKKAGENFRADIAVKSPLNQNLKIYKQRKNMKKIIFDTDIGGDCDDAGALAIIHQAVNCGKAELLAVTVSTRDPWAPACADAINRYYGNIVPIGLCERAPLGDPTMAEFLERYGKHIAENYENEYLPRPIECSMCGGAKQPERAVTLMRRLLAENKGGKITLAVVGSCLNLAALIGSAGDDISPLTGLDLIGTQVDKVVLMGGLFAENATAEYNIKTDIPSAKTVFDKCPVSIYISHFDVGLRIMSGGLMLENAYCEADDGDVLKNPAAESYRFHVGGKRHSWDPIAAFYAIYGTCGVFSDRRRGKVTVDDKGIICLTEGDGNHILIDCAEADISKAEFLLDRAMCGDV